MLQVAARDPGCVEGDWSVAFPDFTQHQMFSLVADIERYPEFMPGCVATRILARGERQWRVDNVFAFGPLRAHFHTRADLAPPDFLEISSKDGPWHSFRLTWRLAPEGSGCRVSCAYSVWFCSRMVAALARSSLHSAMGRIVAAFERRAHQLYG